MRAARSAPWASGFPRRLEGGWGWASRRRIPEVSRFSDGSVGLETCAVTSPTTSQSLLALPVGCMPLEAPEEIGRSAGSWSAARKIPRYLALLTHLWVSERA